MAEEIQKNFVFLTENLTNLPSILGNCLQNSIITKDDMDRIVAGETPLDRNVRFFNLLMLKDWKTIKTTIVNILQKTLNKHCAERIDNKNPSESSRELQSKDSGQLLTSKKIFDSKWWPEEKRLPLAFQERKSHDKLLVEFLKEKLTNSTNGSTVINQEAAVSGMGGVGKTTAAKWFARHYQDSYDHIIWIDCGEESLLTSFKVLAKELKIDTDLPLNLLAKKCFAKMDGAKCLWILDNAECYQGHQGIRDVLPKNVNFHTIITSRTKEWGSETGDGKIPELHLTPFTECDNIEFLKTNLIDEDYLENQLGELGELLGNLPLALQIAVTTVNSKKLTLSQYIERVKITDDIMHQNFDDYEKTINKTMKISLDIIKNHEADYKQTAFKILLILGYIKPEAVKFRLFQDIENLSEIEVIAAMELLEKYSLVTTEKYTFGRYCNIHRLLQQVIRHNGKCNEEITIKRILSVEGFLDYKLIPYLHASEEIRSLFPEVRAHLIDQQKLNDLIDQRRFKEALGLSRMIRDTLMTYTSIFNYAFCLEKMDELAEAVTILENLYIIMEDCVILEPFYSFSNSFNKYGIYQLTEEINYAAVAGLLFFVYIKLRMFDKANRIAKEEGKLLIYHTVNCSLDCIIKFLKEHSTISDYWVSFSARLSHIIHLSCNLENINHRKEISLENCSLSEDLPKDLSLLKLDQVNILNTEGERVPKYDITPTISNKLIELEINCGAASTQFYIKVNGNLFSGSTLYLRNCSILLNPGFRISPRQITLENISIFRDEELEEIGSVCVDEFIDFQNTVYLHLEGKKISLSGDEPYCVGKVYLNKIEKCLDWDKFNWTVNELILQRIDIPLIDKNVFMNINSLRLFFCCVPLNSLFYLAKTVKYLHLHEVTVSMECDEVSNVKVSADSIQLESCKFYLNSEDITNKVFLDKIFDLTKTKRLVAAWDEHIIPPTIDLYEYFSATELDLNRVKIINWETSQSSVESVTLRRVHLFDILYSQFKITKNLTIEDSEIDANSLNNIISSSATLALHHTKVVLPTNYLNSNQVLTTAQHLLHGHHVKEIKLFSVKFLRDGNEVEKMPINQLFNVYELNVLELEYGRYDEYPIELDVANGDISLDILSLMNVKLLNWDKGNGKINEMKLVGIPLLKNGPIGITSLTTWDSHIDLSCLPENIQRITLKRGSRVSCKNKLALQDLSYVDISCDISLLKHFIDCPKLTKIEFSDGVRLDLQLIPKTVKAMKLNYAVYLTDTPATAVIIEKYPLKTVIFKDFSWTDIESTLEKLELENIIIMDSEFNIMHSTFIKLIKTDNMRKIAVGPIDWDLQDEEYKDSWLSKFTEEQGIYYIFQNQRGTVIEEIEFKEMTTL